MAEQMESHVENKPPKWLSKLQDWWNKPPNWAIIFLIFLLFNAFMMAWEGDVFRKPKFASYRDVTVRIRDVRESIFLYLEEKRGIDENYIVTNKEDFFSGLREALYKPIRGRSMRHFFGDGSFKIIIKDNVCYIRVDLDKVTRHISRSPSLLKKDVAYFAASQSKNDFKPGGFLNIANIERGILPGSLYFFGKPDPSSYVLFSEEMNDLYVMICFFKNTPTFSWSEMP